MTTQSKLITQVFWVVSIVGQKEWMQMPTPEVAGEAFLKLFSPNIFQINCLGEDNQYFENK